MSAPEHRLVLDGEKATTQVDCGVLACRERLVLDGHLEEDTLREHLAEAGWGVTVLHSPISCQLIVLCPLHRGRARDGR